MDQEVEIECPTCSKLASVKHEVIASGRALTVKCTLCGTIRKLEARRHTNVIKIKVVMSKYDKSYIRWLDAKPNELLFIGDEFIVENDEANAVRVNAIELKSSVRVESAMANNIQTLWVQAIDKVVVKIAIHAGTVTQSLKIPCSGDKEFIVGSTEKFGKITRIMLLHGEVLKNIGESAKANTIKRIYVKSSMKKPWHGYKNKRVTVEDGKQYQRKFS